jgi:hypothetical protein
MLFSVFMTLYVFVLKGKKEKVEHAFMPRKFIDVEKNP